MNTDRRALVAALVTVCFWSSAFAAIRISLESYGPYHLALVRFAAASLTFVLYALVKPFPLPDRKDWPRFFLTGLSGVTIYHVSLNVGELTVPAGTASMVIGTAPVFTALLSAWFLGERLTWTAWSGLGLSLFGIATISLGGGESFGFTSGVAYTAIAAVCGAAFFVQMKPILAKYRPFEAMACVTWAGTLPLFVFAPGVWHTIASASWVATASAIYIGIFPAGVAYAAWSYVLSKLPAGQTASFLYLVPPLAIGWGWWWAGEVPGWTSLLGGAIAMCGVVLVQWAGRTKLARRGAHARG